MTPFPVNISRSIDAPTVPNNTPRNPPSCCFTSCFTVSLTPLINTPEFFSDFISSFEITKVIPFSALTNHRSRIFL